MNRKEYRRWRKQKGMGRDEMFRNIHDPNWIRDWNARVDGMKAEHGEGKAGHKPGGNWDGGFLR